MGKKSYQKAIRIFPDLLTYLLNLSVNTLLHTAEHHSSFIHGETFLREFDYIKFYAHFAATIEVNNSNEE